MVENLWSTKERGEKLEPQAHMDVLQKQPEEDRVCLAVRRHSADHHDLHHNGGAGEEFV